MAVSSSADFFVTLGVQDNFTPAMQQAVNTAEQVVSSMGRLSLNIITMNQALELAQKAWSALGKIVEMVGIHEYAEAEKNVLKLSFALANQGQDVEAGVKHFEHLTNEIQRNSTASEDTLMKLAAQSKALGLTTDMTDKLLRGSVDLAAVMDTDVDQAFQQLLSSLAGNARGIGRYIKAVRDMTPEMLQAGGAVEYVANKMKGFAEREAGTMLGRTEQIKNGFKQLKQSLGELSVTAFTIPGLNAGPSPIAKTIFDIVEELKSLIPVVVEARNKVLAFFGGLKIAFIDVDWTGIFGSFTRAVLQAAAAVAVFAVASNLSLIIASIPLIEIGFALITARLWAMAKAFTAASASIAVTAVKFTAVALGAVTTAIAIDLIIRNIDKLGKLFATSFLHIIGGAVIVVRELVNLIGMIPGMGGPTEAALGKIDGLLESMAVSAGEFSEGLDLGFAGKVFTEGQKFMRNLAEGTDLTAKKLKEAEAKAKDFGVVLKASVGTAVKLTDELKKQLDEILKRYKDNQQAISEAGLTEGQAIILRATAAREAIVQFERELKIRGMLTTEIKNQLAAAREAEGVRGNIELDKLRVKMMTEAVTKADELQQSLDKQRMTERELVAADLKRTTAAIDLQRFNALQNETWTPEMERVLQGSAKAAKELAAIKMSELPMTMRDAFKEISKGFKAVGTGSVWSGLWQMGKGVASAIGTAIMIAADYVGEVLEGAFSVAKGLFGGGYVDVVSDIIDAVGSIPQMLTTAMTRLGSVIDKIVSQFPVMVQQLVAALPGIVDKIVAAFPQLIATIADSLPKIAQTIGQQFPRIIAALMDAIPKLVEMLPSIIAPLLDGLVNAVGIIIDKLPAILTSIFQTLPKLAVEIFRAIPSLVANLLENIDDVIFAFVDGLIASEGEIVGGFIDQFFMQGGAERLIGSIIRSIPKIVFALVRGIASGLSKALKGIMGGGFGAIKAPAALIDLPKKLEGSFKKLGQIVSADTSKLFAVKDFDRVSKGATSVATSIGNAITQATTAGEESLNSWWSKFSDWLSKVWEGMIAGLVEVWRGIIGMLTTVWELLRQVWLFIFDLLNRAWAVLTEVWRGIVDLLGRAWTALTEVWRGIFDLLGKAWAALTVVFQWVIDKVITPIIQGITAVWQWVLDNVILPLINGLQAVWQFALDLIVNPLINGFKAVWQFALDSIVNPLINGLQAVWQFALDSIVNPIINGLNSAWQTVIDKVVTPLTSFKLPNWSWPTMPKFTWPSFNAFKWPALPSFPSLPRFPALPSFPAIATPTWLQNFINAVSSLVNWKLEIPAVGGGGGATWPPWSTGGKLQPIYAAEGLAVPRPIGADIIPIMASPGEFIVNARSASANAGTLAAINASRGIPVSSAGTSAPQTVQLNVTINAKTILDADEIKRQVIPAIDQHLKRRSLDGAFVLAAAGVQTR